MRDIGDKIAAQALEEAKLRDVPQHDDGADAAAVAVAQGRAADVQNLLAIAVQHKVIFNRLGAFQRSTRKTAQIGIADNLLETATAHVGLLTADQGGCRAVQADHPLFGINRQHAFRHAGENRLLFVTLASNRMPPLFELSGKQVERFGQSSQFVDIRHGHSFMEVTAGNPLCAFAQVSDRFGKALC